MSQFKVGDRVRLRSGRGQLYWNPEMERFVNKEAILGAPDKEGDFRIYGWFWAPAWLELINKTGDQPMSNVLQRVRDFAIGEPLKSYVKYGIKAKDGHLTEDGVSILLDVLSDKYDAELQAVVKQLAADDKANKSE